MKKENILIWGLTVLFSVLMSVPFIIPHTGFLALIGIVPLLCMERIASMLEKKRIWIYHYSAFVLWNAITTFWVCNATVGGGLFAVFANALSTVRQSSKRNDTPSFSRTIFSIIFSMLFTY